MIPFGSRSGNASTMNETTRGAERTGRPPDLKQPQDVDCDGKNPVTGRPCLLGHHRGFHRDETGAEWLDK